MSTFSGRTINELVFEAIKALIKRGDRTSSRNGDILVLYNVLFTLEHPRSRHLSLIGRKSNIFALIAETFWVLAGENVLDPFLSFFLSRAHDFSDDGKTWRGGYGPRLYLYDQLDDAISVFEEEGIQSRKSVISIYLPELDTKKQLKQVYGLVNTKDRPCNNMMHFFISPDKRLHMTVHQRSGDVIWGMGSINIFEWTFLQEFVLSEVRRRVDAEVHLGTYNHFVTNLHMYDFTSKQGYEAVKAEYDQVLNRLNASKLQFPATVKTNRQFFLELVALYSQAIENHDQNFPQLMQKITTHFVAFFDEGEITANLLFGYATVVAAYICSKQGNREIEVDLNHFSDEFVVSVAESGFRKFNIKGYEPN